MLELDLLLMICFLFAGLYSLYTALRLRRTTELFDNMLLYPGNCKREDCCDPEGFMAYMRPRLTIFGSLCVLISLYYVVKRYMDLPKAVAIAHIVFSLGSLCWGFWIYNRAARRFW